MDGKEAFRRKRGSMDFNEGISRLDRMVGAWGRTLATERGVTNDSQGHKI